MVAHRAPKGHTTLARGNALGSQPSQYLKP